MSTQDLLERMRRNPRGIRFKDLCNVCDACFGRPRQAGSSHRIYRTPWQGDPRVNIQSKRGMARPYQVRQVLRAIDRMKDEHEGK